MAPHLVSGRGFNLSEGQFRLLRPVLSFGLCPPLLCPVAFCSSGVFLENGLLRVSFPRNQGGILDWTSVWTGPPMWSYLPVSSFLKKKRSFQLLKIRQQEEDGIFIGDLV